jgi:hypothetical protein
MEKVLMQLLQEMKEMKSEFREHFNSVDERFR